MNLTINRTSPISSSARPHWFGYVGVALVLSLAACGGGHDTGTLASEKTSAASTEEVTSPNFQPSTEAPPSAETITLQQQGARLNSEELQKIAKTGVLPKASAGPSLSGDSADQRFGADNTTKESKDAKSAGLSPKYATTKTAAYRFYNTLTSAHFYTTSEAERDNVRKTLPFMSYEGPAFSASSSTVPGLSPVHRFFNSQTGVHFYTISEEERAHVVANLPQFKYEGVAYHASTLPGTGYTPLFRFFLAAKGYHFYTNSEEERDRIRATLPQYSYEGIGYYVLSDDWQTPAVPHTGVDRDLCYRAGSNALVGCDTPEALSLNPKQDGHLQSTPTWSFEAVGECRRDRVTGLVWEEKASSGLRWMNNLYTNHGDKRADDTSSYVDYVNSTALCGFTDWRLPSVEELRGLVNFGVPPTSPLISTNAFPNTAAGDYWTSTGSVENVNQAWIVKFNQINNNAYGGPIDKSTRIHARLVRGAPWTGQRYMVTSVAYSQGASTDTANNAVIDRKTGLIWRRCLEGQTWASYTCVGTSVGYTHEGALALTKTQDLPWRVPNIKEVQTLVDYRQFFPPALDSNAFPHSGGSLWSSTPSIVSPERALMTEFARGITSRPTRDSIFRVRLVSHIPTPN